MSFVNVSKYQSIHMNVLGVRTQIVISNSSLRERKGYTEFYCITGLLSIDMAIYDSIVIFLKINAYDPVGPYNFIR